MPTNAASGTVVGGGCQRLVENSVIFASSTVLPPLMQEFPYQRSTIQRGTLGMYAVQIS